MPPLQGPSPELLIQGFSPLQGLSKSPLLAPPFKGFSISTISPRVPLLYTLSRDNPTPQTISPDPLVLPTQGPLLLPRSAPPAPRALSPHPLRAPPPQHSPRQRVTVSPSALAPCPPCRAVSCPPGPPTRPGGSRGTRDPAGPALPGQGEL